jgi:hypothetical protein
MEIRGVGLNRTSFNRRVFTTYLLASSYLNTALKDADELKKSIKQASQFPEDIIIKYKKEKSGYTFNMIDVYENRLIPLSVTLHNGLKCNPIIKRKRPSYYIIESELSIVTDKLSILGLEIDTLKYDEILEVESYKILSSKKSPILFQGFHENIVKTEIITEKKNI